MEIFCGESLGMSRTTDVIQRRTVAPVEDVAFHPRAIFARDGHVAAIVEGFLQRVAQIGFGGKLRNPAFDLLRDRVRRRLQDDRLSGYVAVRS